MAGRILLPSIVAIGVFLTSGAFAQSVSPDEAVDRQGGVRQQLTLTAAQKNALYIAVLQQKVRPTPAVSNSLPRAIGAPVPSYLELADLPDETGAEPWAALLKYAMVEDDVIVVDPIRLRVVEVIHGGAKP